MTCKLDEYGARFRPDHKRLQAERAADDICPVGRRKVFLCRLDQIALFDTVGEIRLRNETPNRDDPAPGIAMVDGCADKSALTGANENARCREFQCVRVIRVLVNRSYEHGPGAPYTAAHNLLDTGQSDEQVVLLFPLPPVAWKV
jgi:hypothetical protein